MDGKTSFSAPLGVPKPAFGLFRIFQVPLGSVLGSVGIVLRVHGRPWAAVERFKLYLGPVLEGLGRLGIVLGASGAIPKRFPRPEWVGGLGRATAAHLLEPLLIHPTNTPY